MNFVAKLEFCLAIGRSDGLGLRSMIEAGREWENGRTRVGLQRPQKEEKCVRNGHRAVAPTFS
jgi:hypothetical protein